ncbi:MAG: transcription antitermination factor NusB [Oscillospiraceae bacterium]|nr:transcription antitermination factor NusB [Oscillospiraceae bacterium]
MKNNKLNRHEIRQAALILLYQAEVLEAIPSDGSLEPAPDIENIKADCVEAFGLAVDSEVMKLVRGVLENKAALDEIINKYSPVRKVERIPKINLAIMRMALYEMDFMAAVPDKVALNEAIELSKEFAFSPDSKLIGGLIGGYYKDKHNVK